MYNGQEANAKISFKASARFVRSPLRELVYALLKLGNCRR